MKRYLKILINHLLRIVEKRPKKIINISGVNAKTLFSHKKNYKIITQTYLSSKTTVYPKCLKTDTIQHFKPFESNSNITILSITSNNTKFCLNHFLDEDCNVLYENGINLSDLSISYKKLPIPIQLNGSIAYLSNSNVSNYGHWFQYTFPLLKYYWDIIGKNNIDFYYIGDSKLKSFQKESLLKAGIKESQIINYPCKANQSYICVKNNKIQHNYARYNEENAFIFPRSIFSDYLTIDELSPKKIFIKRGNVKYRKLINELAVEAYLLKKGFVSITMDNLSIKNQAILFYNAKYIIAPHGSSLTNLLFTQPETFVLELFPFGYPDWFNFTYASYAKSNYHFLIGEDINQLTKPLYRDIYIDLKKIDKIQDTFKIHL